MCLFDCGLQVVAVPSTNIASVCSQVTYTVTVTNNGDITVRNAFLTVPVDCTLALLNNSVTVNGQTVEVENMDQIPLGDIEPGATSTVTYTVVVMEYKRCIYTRGAPEDTIGIFPVNVSPLYFVQDRICLYILFPKVVIPVKCLPHGLKMGGVFLLLIIICQFLHLFVAFRIGLNEGSELNPLEGA